jgi:hypothetical protein
MTVKTTQLLSGIPPLSSSCSCDHTMHCCPVQDSMSCVAAILHQGCDQTHLWQHCEELQHTAHGHSRVLATELIHKPAQDAPLAPLHSRQVRCECSNGQAELCAHCWGTCAELEQQLHEAVAQLRYCLCRKLLIVLLHLQGWWQCGV